MIYNDFFNIYILLLLSLILLIPLTLEDPYMSFYQLLLFF